MGFRALGARPKKRLISAAQAWARSYLGAAVDNSDEIRRLESINAPPDIVQRLRDEQAENDFDVDETEMEIVLLFLRLSRQWRVLPSLSGAPTFLGLDLGVAALLLQARQTQNIADTLDEIILMERAAADALNKILNERASKKK